MAANTAPVFTLKPVIGIAQINTANTARDGTGTLGTVVTGTTDGTRVDRITVTATGTTTNGMIRFFINDGVNTRLFAELAVTAITPSGTVAAFTGTLVFDRGLILPVTWNIQASTNNAETFNVIAFAGDYS